MLKSYKYRIYPTKSQTELLGKHFGCARWIYNWGLAKRIAAYTKEKKSIGIFSLINDLPQLKREVGTMWLSDVSSASLQAALRNLDTAYTAFFRKKAEFPKFKNKLQRQCYHLPAQCKIDFDTRKIFIPKFTEGIRCVIDRSFSGKIKTCTVSKTSTGKYFISVLVDNGIEVPAPKLNLISSDIVGVDLGLKHFAVLSTGEKIENPKPLKWAQRKLARVQRQLARKQKGSKNREKCRKRVALIHERVANRRRDFQHKLSTRLIRENQAVAVETLNVVGMQKNHRLARSISDAGWSAFVEMLEYKARWYGKSILRIGQFEPSSKLCSCGIINSELKLSQREWTCKSCGVTHDRDILAANNIKCMALNSQNFLAQGMREFKPVESGKRRTTKQECVGAN